jgi:hypothetical protein
MEKEKLGMAYNKVLEALNPTNSLSIDVLVGLDLIEWYLVKGLRMAK